MRWLQRFAVFVAVLVLSGCGPSITVHHKIDPIFVNITINHKIQKELEDVFAFEKDRSAESETSDSK